jgi:anti-sigma regulatory factor (Ser/Thr protein kinase)
MIFKFLINGDEEKIISFEKELLALLEKSLMRNDIIPNEIHFCVHEAILNIIQHTYKWDFSLPIDIQIVITDTENNKKVIEIFIKDVGKPIKKELHPPKSLRPFQMRQRGLYMIAKIMDEFFIKPLDDKSGNLTYMRKEISL